MSSSMYSSHFWFPCPLPSLLAPCLPGFPPFPSPLPPPPRILPCPGSESWPHWTFTEVPGPGYALPLSTVQLHHLLHHPRSRHVLFFLFPFYSPLCTLNPLHSSCSQGFYFVFTFVLFFFSFVFLSAKETKISRWANRKNAYLEILKEHRDKHLSLLKGHLPQTGSWNR